MGEKVDVVELVGVESVDRDLCFRVVGCNARGHVDEGFAAVGSVNEVDRGIANLETERVGCEWFGDQGFDIEEYFDEVLRFGLCGCVRDLAHLREIGNGGGLASAASEPVVEALERSWIGAEEVVSEENECSWIGSVPELETGTGSYKVNYDGIDFILVFFEESQNRNDIA